jgi:hypothetical protein
MGREKGGTLLIDSGISAMDGREMVPKTSSREAQKLEQTCGARFVQALVG